MAKTSIENGNGERRQVPVILKLLMQAVLVVVALGGIMTVFYTSQAAQDEDRSNVKQRVTATETNLDSMKDVQKETKAEIEKQNEEFTKTLVKMAEMAIEQRTLSIEQKTISEVQRDMNKKIDGMHEILLEIKAKGE
jgi:uncharacterized protein HemX